MTRVLPLCAMLALAACGSGQKVDPSQQVGPHPYLPKPAEELVADVGVAKVVGWKQGEAPTVPAGFKIEAMATGLTSPRNVYPLANGDILVVESQRVGSEPVDRPKDPIRDFIMSIAHGGGGAKETAGAGGGPPQRITLLRDADGDGRPELKTVLLDHLNSPFGVAAVGGQLYVANTDALVRYPFTPGQTRITAPGQLVTALPGGLIDHHWTKSLAVSPDGSKLYVGVGSNSNIGENGLDTEDNRANILEVNTAKGDYRIYAAGMRNPVGMAFNPRTGDLWAVVNERDMIGSDLVPDYLTRVEFGGFYGWPWNYWGGYEDKRVQPDRPELREYTHRPDYALGNHVAPLGLTFAQDLKLGAPFENGAFVGLHGSWNRKPMAGYKVVFVKFDAGDRASGKPVDVLSGFLTPEGKAHGRPVDVTADKTGALLVSDDVGGVIWRVRK